MRIVFVSHYALPHKGGIEFVIDALKARFRREGHSIAHLASNAGIPSNPDPTLTTVSALNVLERYGIPFPLFQPFSLLRSARRILNDADVVHVHGVLYLSSVISAVLARRRGIPVVVTEHVGQIEYRSALVNWLEALAFATLGRICARNASAITVLNGKVEAEMRRLAGSAIPILKIANGVDTDRFRPAAPEARAELRHQWKLSRFTALFVGRLVEKKGYNLLVQSADGSFDILLCGEGGQVQSEGDIRALGSLEQAQIIQLYQAADVLVLPSEGEGFPLVVQEALACGLPIVVTDNAINREYLDESVAVFVRRDVDALRATLRQLMTDPARQQEMSAAGRAWALAHFSWDHAQAAYLSLYRLVCQPQDVEHGITAQAVGDKPAE